MALFLIYKDNERTGQKTMLGTQEATSNKSALKKFYGGRKPKAGRYFVVPHKVHTKYVILKR